jgi:hypothetical protein
MQHKKERTFYKYTFNIVRSRKEHELTCILSFILYFNL